MRRPVIGFYAAGPHIDAVLDPGSVEMGGVQGLGGNQHVAKYGTIAGIPAVGLYSFGYPGDTFDGEQPNPRRHLFVSSHETNLKSPWAAFYRLHVQVVVSFNGWGSLHGEVRPKGSIGVLRDLVDLGHIGPTTVYPPDFGWVRVEVGEPVGGPFCTEYVDVMASVLESLYGGQTARSYFTDGILVNCNGPRNETKAEIAFFRSLGNLVGTNGRRFTYGREFGLSSVALCYASDEPGRHSSSQWGSIPLPEVGEVMRRFAKKLPPPTDCACKKEFRVQMARLANGFWPNFVHDNAEYIWPTT